MANIDEKKAQVENIKEAFGNAKSAVIVKYRGLNAAQVTDLRNKFRENGVVYKVFKNNLVKIAIEGTEFESLKDELVGPNGIAFGIDDAVVPAKVAKDFSKTNPMLELTCGVVEGRFYDTAGIIEIAGLPSREELIGRFMGSVKSSISNFAYLLANIIKEKEKGEGGEEVPA